MNIMNHCIRSILTIPIQWIEWKSHLILSILRSLEMILTSIPMVVLPANIVMVVPLIGMSICCLLHCCISWHDSYLKMGWDNVGGCALLFISIFLLLFQERNTAALLTQNDFNFDKKYISNLILFVIGCLLMMAIDISTNRFIQSQDRCR